MTTLKKDLIHLCDIWKDHPHINYLTRLMAMAFKSAVEDMPNNNDEILFRVVDMCGVYDTDSIFLPLDHYCFVGRAFSLIATNHSISWREIDELTDKESATDAGKKRPRGVNVLRGIFPVLEKLVENKMAEKRIAWEEALKARSSSLTLLQGSRQQNSLLESVPVDILRAHILPHLCPGSNNPEITQKFANTTVSFFQKNLSSPRQAPPKESLLKKVCSIFKF